LSGAITILTEKRYVLYKALQIRNLMGVPILNFATTSQVPFLQRSPKRPLSLVYAYLELTELIHPMWNVRPASGVFLDEKKSLVVLLILLEVA
jgi:hypothetical protein